MAPTDDLTPLLDAAVEALGGQTRPGQIAMAKAVAASLDDRVHLLVQAGTGTGKSLAYLVPAVRHAMATENTVVVATATIALQRQLKAAAIFFSSAMSVGFDSPTIASSRYLPATTAPGATSADAMPVMTIGPMGAE